MMRLIAIAFLLLAPPAAAQTFELTPFASGGYATSAGIEKKAAGVQDLEVSGGFTWGANLAVFLSQHLGVELMWARQATDVRLSTSTGSARLFDMNIDQLLVNAVYQFGGASATIRPFVFGGLGGATLSARDIDHETKLAWTLGGGVKWFPLPKIGARAHIRYRPTQLNDSSSTVCDPFGFCQDSLQQVEFAGGFVVRF